MYIIDLVYIIQCVKKIIRSCMVISTDLVNWFNFTEYITTDQCEGHIKINAIEDLIKLEKDDWYRIIKRVLIVRSRIASLAFFLCLPLLIALAVYNPDYINNFFFSTIIKGIGKVVEEQRFDLRVSTTNNKYIKIRKSPYYTRLLNEKKIDGILRVIPSPAFQTKTGEVGSHPV